jgi:hypothetical protein
MSTKTKLYVYPTADNSPVYNLLPAHSICNENSRLTDTEKELLKAIGNTKSKSAYAGIIRQRCQEIERSSDVVLFTELIETLSSQLNDCEATMQNILSESGISALKNLSHNDWLKQANGSLVLSNQIHSS